jgi:hypothetical protein
VAGVVAVGALIGILRFMPLCSVDGVVVTKGASRAKIVKAHVVLIQGADAGLLVETGALASAPEDIGRDGEVDKIPFKWIDTDQDGRFRFERVHWRQAIVVGFAELDDGRLCRTSESWLTPIVGSYRAELNPSLEKCYRKTKATEQAGSKGTGESAKQPSSVDTSVVDAPAKVGELPKWLPLYPGVSVGDLKPDPAGGANSFVFPTRDQVAAVIHYYKKEFEKKGFRTKSSGLADSKASPRRGSDVIMVELDAVDKARSRSVSMMVVAVSGTTTVKLAFYDKQLSEKNK